ACLEEPEPLLASGGELGRLYGYFKRREWLKIGGSHDRFLVLSDHPLGPSGKSIGTRLAAIDPRWVEEAPFPQEPDGREHFARAVRYRGRHYETGPLARAMVARHPLARKLHRRYKDSMMVRIAVRVAETARLLWGVRERLGRLRLDEPSYIEPPLSFEALGSVEGRGAVEAARGSLLHTLRLKNGKIARYCIVTPTQWNLVGDGGGEPGVAQRALQGLPVELAETVFKSFDVCSVCTTQ
ncbi:nickel-dependent hydrogenase large subunit, partial [Hydrogenimonas sp.]